MNAKKGYYSLIQFCPDASRLEAVNVGVLLFCPEMHFIAARIAKSNQRATKLVGRTELDKASLNAAKRAIERRLQTDRQAFMQFEDLEKFVNSRGNVLKLTQPRPVKVFNPENDLNGLFGELVGGTAKAHPADLPEIPVISKLDSVFQDLERQGRARLNWNINIPVLGRPLHVPYAYRNGVWNLVKHYHFSTQEGTALRAAERLAIEGDLLFKNPTDENEQTKLVVVSSFEKDEDTSDIRGRVENVLRIYNVKTVSDTQVNSFLAEVKKEAHA